ncbi:MAG TPA: porin family protein [Chitinophagaceae bacterium]|nr:porin family protein [Chitinophagaceae bacterium]
MKKTFLALIAVTLVYITCPAQFGILGGVNFSKYEYVSDRKALISWNAGLLYRIAKSSSTFAMQPQLTYTGKGAIKYPEIDPNNDILKYTNHINYLQLSVPFIISPKLDDEGTLRFDIGAGPYVANVVSAKSSAESYEGETTTSDFKVGSSSTDDFKPFDAGITMMAGTRIGNISFNVQYDLGLLNVNPVTTAPPLKMRAFMFNMLVYFGK